MACGKGRHLKWFGQAGMEIFGSDLSEQSIQEAGSNIPSADLKVHDMRNPIPFTGMDLTVNLFTSLGYFDSAGDDRKIIRNAYDSLRSGGYFVLDYMNTEHIGSSIVPKNEQTIGDVIFRISREMKDGVVRKTIMVEDQEEKYQFVEQVRAYGKDDLVKMISESGFQDIEVFGKDMAESVNDSERVVILARKP